MDGITIRAIEEADAAEWHAMWAAYCTFYQTALSDAVTATTWQRLLDPASPIHALIAESATGEVLGFANYVLHLHTWSADTICYLEDLFVKPETRGQGIGKKLIDALIERGTAARWNRVYWMTQATNTTARRLYDRFTAADEFVRYTVTLG